MKRNILFGSALLLAASLMAADPSPKEDVAAAAKKLGEKANYSWKTTVVVPESSRFKPGPTEGKTEKDGFTLVTMSFGDNTTKALIKGEKAAVTGQDGGWQALSELDSEGPGRFMGTMVKGIKAPAVQAAELLAETKDLKKEGDVYSGSLSEAAVKPLLAFRRGGGGGGGEATVKDAKGSVKYWLKDGVLSKFEFKVQGKVTFGENEREVDRATTVEIKDVGTTKMDVPEEAKKKLS